jgi:membrane associated rhomboid family serine protease
MNLTPSREPILNVPPVVVATLGLMGLVHAARLFLSRQADLEFLLAFAFIPARYDAGILPGGGLPGGWGAQIWTFVTYALIHADLMHLGINAVWLLAFGTPLARRLGTTRFLAFFTVTAIAGAAAHLATHAGELVPMIGASAAISGAMAAAMRFAFQRGGPIWRGGDDVPAYHAPAISLGAALRDPRILAFFAVWFGINLLFGLGSISLTGGDQPIAWQAHVGGFLAGLLLFGFFDPVRGDGPATSNPPREAG